MLQLNKDLLQGFTKDNLKRFFNFRPLLLIFLTIIGAVYSVIKVFLGSFVPLAIFGVFVAFNLIVFVISFFKKDVLSNFFKIFGVKSVKVCCLIVLISAILFSSIASITFLVNNNRELANGNYSISAKVKEVATIENKTKLLLGNIEINGKSYGFNIQASVTDDDFNVGDDLSFSSYIYATKLVNHNSINSSILKTNIHYYCSINLDTLTKQSGKAFFVDSIKDKSKTILFENMNSENAGFSYAVLFGDKSLLTETYSTIFRSGGLAHILAVSGMHIAFLVGLVLFVLKLFKVKKKAQFFAVFAVLFVYNFLCNFSPSVFRASVMSLCLMLGMILGERSDNLSNIALAGIIILTFQSLFLFDVGFLLSFSSVFGIFLFSKMFEKVLNKIKMPKFVSSSVSVIVGATLGTLPWICKYFKIFAPISILSNLIVVPLFSIMYIVLLLSITINIMFSAPIFIAIAQFFVNIVVNWSSVFAKFAVISTINFDTLCAIIYYAICFFASPYFIITNKSKLISILSMIVVLTSCLANCNSAKIINKNMVFANESTSKTLFFTTKSGKTILSNISNEKYFTYEIDNLLLNENINKIDYIFLYNYQDNMQKNVSSIVNKYKTLNVYLFGDYSNSTLLGLANSLYSANILTIVNNQNISVDDGNIQIKSYKHNNLTMAVSYQFDSEKILQIISSVSQSQIISQDIFAEQYSILYAQNFYSRYLNIMSNCYICCNSYADFKSIYALQPDECYRFAF